MGVRLDRLLTVLMVGLVLAIGLCLLDGESGVDPCFLLLAVPVAIAALGPLPHAGRVVAVPVGSIGCVPQRSPRPPS